MNTKYANKIISVLLGIALIVLVLSFFSLIFEAIFIGDLILLNVGDGKLNEIATLLKWMSVSLVCVLVPVIVCYVFAYFGNGKIFNVASAVLSLLVAATCVAFIFVLRKWALDTESAEIYSAVAEGLEELITLAATSVLLCAFFVYNSVASFKKKQEGKLLAETAEGQSDEEV